MAIIEAKLTVLKARRERFGKEKGFDHRNMVAKLGLGPRAPSPGLSPSPPPVVFRGQEGEGEKVLFSLGLKTVLC